MDIGNSSKESLDVKTTDERATAIETIQAAISGPRNTAKRRFGVRVNNQFIVVTCGFDPESFTITIQEVAVGESQVRRRTVVLEHDRAEAIAQDLTSGVDFRTLIVHLLSCPDSTSR